MRIRMAESDPFSNCEMTFTFSLYYLYSCHFYRFSHFSLSPFEILHLPLFLRISYGSFEGLSFRQSVRRFNTHFFI